MSVNKEFEKMYEAGLSEEEIAKQLYLPIWKVWELKSHLMVHRVFNLGMDIPLFDDLDNLKISF